MMARPTQQIKIPVAVKKWRFPKIRGTFVVVPIIRIIVFWGLPWGPPILGNYQMSPNWSGGAGPANHVQAMLTRTRVKGLGFRVQDPILVASSLQQLSLSRKLPSSLTPKLALNRQSRSFTLYTQTLQRHECPPPPLNPKPHMSHCLNS